MITRLYILLFALAVTGCDLAEIGANAAMVVDVKQPKVMLGSSAVLQISEAEVARILGPDKCPAHEMPEWLFGPAIETDGCTMLSGKKTVEVTLITDTGHFKERWKVAEGLASSSPRISLSRPNGWVLREPHE